MKRFTNMRLSALVALAILMIPSGWTRATDGKAPDCYILAVGVDKYLHEPELSGGGADVRSAISAFAAQKGKMFNVVYARTLLDAQATKANIMKGMQDFSRLGKAGDFFVFYLDGHGGNYADDGGWYFCPHDEDPDNNDFDLTSDEILTFADGLMKQGKKVMIIVEACHAGTLGKAAQIYLNRYQNPNGGGLILALSSQGSQESWTVGPYSPFARALAEGISGAADANRDGQVTLQELKTYSYGRTYQLLRQNRNNAKQDSTILWSKSMTANTPLALLQGRTSTATQTGNWIGSETLADYGKLTFQMNPGGRAVMIDAKETSEGTWQQTGNQITLRFYDGRVVYTGTLNGSSLSGSASNGRTQWNFTVRRS